MSYKNDRCDSGPDPDIFTFRSDLGSRLRELEKRFSNRETAAKAAGVAKSTLQNWIEGKSDPSFLGLVRLCQAAGEDLNWLASGKAPHCGAPLSVHRAGQTDRDGLKPELVAIPVYNASADAGNTTIDENSSSLVALDKVWLHRNFCVRPATLAVFPTTGESMEPTIRSDELILFDTSKKGCAPTDGIFVIRLEGTILVKRLQHLPGGLIRVTSDNAAYEAYTVQLNSGVDFEILGRVLLVLGLRAV